MAVLNRNLTMVIASTTGTGSNVNVDIGFIPTAINGQDVTGGLVNIMWSQGLNSATGGSTLTAFYATGAGTAGFATIGQGAGGIVTLDGSAGNGIGFVLGTNTTINVAAHAYIFTCWR